MLTAAEIRGSALAYYQVKMLLKQPLPDQARAHFEAFLATTVSECSEVTETSAPARWAAGEIGPVLAAAVGAAIWLGEVSSASTALRIFGLVGNRALSGQSAWAKVSAYLDRQPGNVTFSPETITRISKECGLVLKLGDSLTAVDVLEELTRPRTGGFPVQVAQWLADHFHEHGMDDNAWGAAYRKALEDSFALNDRVCAPTFIISHSASARPTRAEWEAMVAGRVPHSRLEVRASYVVTRAFITEYWERCHAKKAAPVSISA